MKLTQGRPIFQFSEGDTITRVVSTIDREEHELVGEGDEIKSVMVQKSDTAFRGEPVIYRGIVNNMIYVERLSNVSEYEDKLSKLEVEFYSNGWEYWVDPEEYIKNSSALVEKAKKLVTKKLIKDAKKREE